MKEYTSATITRVGVHAPSPNATTNHLSKLVHLFAQQPTAEQLQEDPSVYSVQRVLPVDDQTPEFSLTTIYPGMVGTEFFFTRGHDHQPPKGETYFCVSGEGGLVVQKGDIYEWLPMEPGTVIQLRFGWAHRTVNTGDKPLVFAGQYIAPFEVDYTISEQGFAARIHTDGAAGIRIVTK